MPATLTSDEVAAVLRRAAELEGELEEARGTLPDRIELEAVAQAAGEVGISIEAVRQAYAELRVGGLPAASATARRRGQIIGPATVAERRVVYLSPDAVRDRLGRLLRRGGFGRPHAGGTGDCPVRLSPQARERRRRARHVPRPARLTPPHANSTHSGPHSGRQSA